MAENEICRLRTQHSNLCERLYRLLNGKDETMKSIRRVLARRIPENPQYKKVLDELKNQANVEDFYEILMGSLSYLDFDGLLDELIRSHGNYELKIDIESYRRDLLTFLGCTTIQQAAQATPPWWCAQHNHHHLQQFSKVRTRVLKDPASFRLINLIDCRMRFTCAIGLHQLIFFVMSIEELNSFVVSWLIPSALVPILADAVKSENVISVFQTYKISLLSIMTEVTLYSVEAS